MDSGIFGLAAFGFWLFIGAAVVSGVWDSIRKREAEHETLRRMIEAGKPPDQQLVDKLLGTTDKDTSRDLTTAGLIVIFVAPGLALMGYLIGQGAFMPLLGVGSLVAFVGVGLLVAAQFVKRSERKDTGYPPLG